MNHIKIKLVFIVLFLFINLFLGYLLYHSHWQETSISEEAVQHTVSALRKRNVQVDKSIIPRSNQKMREVSVKNIVEDSSSFVALLQETGWKKIDSGFQRNSEMILFSDGKFEYTGKIALEKELSGEQLSDAVLKKLKDLCIDIKGIKLKTIEQVEKGMRLEYVQTYEGYEIFGTRLTVSVKGSAIVSLYGIWLEPMDIQSKRQDTLFATEALVQFAQEEHHSPVRITEIKSGYYISELDENISHKVMQMLPSFQITTALGTKFYYDARSPQQ
ncbi:MAG: hypothetical protein E7399_05010 [Ruminococcaceae bacterium]|nr:hypothetical protein [Oscillospiraceae bacterium]